MDDQPVFIDEASPDELGGRVGPPTPRSPRNSCRSRASSSATSPRTRRLFHSTVGSVVEKTTFGIAFQIRANSRIGSVAAGSDSPVGQ